MPGALTPESVEAAREVIRQAQLERVRVGCAGFRCDACGAVSGFVDMHEIVNRRRTPPSALARLLSYQPELTMMLCRRCHDAAHTTSVRLLLFSRAFQLYTEARVRLVYDLLIRAHGGQSFTGIFLP